MDSNKKIVLGFLGGLPQKSDVDIWEHWEKFFKINSTKKNNIEILLHPFEHIEDKYIKSVQEFNKISGLDTKIVDISNHVLTEWGTSSLADATLLMMQDCLEKNINIKKFILLSNTCCPIFSIDFIVEELLNSNKSWIHGNSLNKLNNELYPESSTNFKFFKDDTYVHNDEKVSLYYSNWMILDYVHIKYFFLNLTIRCFEASIKSGHVQTPIIKTYVKREEIYICKFEKPNQGVNVNNLPNDPNYKYLHEFKTFFSKPYFPGSDQYDGEKINYCWPIEEIIFGNLIVKKLLELNKNLLNELKIIDIDSIEDEIKTNNACYYDKLSSLFECFKNKKYIYVEPVLNNDNRGISFMNKQLNSSFYIGTSVPFLKDDSKRLVSPTYIDWTKVSLDPRNIFREFKIKAINLKLLDPRKKLQSEKTLWNNFDINKFLELETPELALGLLKEYDADLIKNNVVKLLNNEMIMKRSLTILPLIPSTWHPLEYSSWSLKNMVNSFILLNYMKKIFLQSNSSLIDKTIFNFDEAYEYYRHEILNNKIEIRKIIYDDVLLEMPIINSDIPKYSENIYGCFVNPNTIISARSLGSFFLRKCKKGSHINNYSELLFEDPNIHIKKYISRLVIDKLPQYGIKLKDWNDFKTKISAFRSLNEQTLNDNPELLNFFMNNIANVSEYTFDNHKYYKFNGFTKNFKLRQIKELGRGAWNVALLVANETTNPDQPGKAGDQEIPNTFVLRHFYTNVEYGFKSIAKMSRSSFYDNLIGIIITIIQSSILKTKITNSVYMLGYDVNTNLFDKKYKRFEEDKKFKCWQESIMNSKFILSLNEKVDGDCLSYIIKQIENEDLTKDTIIKEFNYLSSCIFQKLKLLQDKFKFIHNDLKLDNVFYQMENGKVIVLLSDFGSSELTINGYRIKGNPDFITKTNDEKPYYGKDIMYYFINALQEFQTKYNSEIPDYIKNNYFDLIVHIINLIKSLYSTDKIQEFSNNFQKVILNREIIENTDTIKSLLKSGRLFKSSDIFLLDYSFYDLTTEFLLTIINCQDLCENYEIKQPSSLVYYNKYLKYKSKYMMLKQQLGGHRSECEEINKCIINKLSNKVSNIKTIADMKILKDICLDHLSYNWDYQTYDISVGKFKCKHFKESDHDLLMMFKHDQRRPEKIFKSLYQDTQILGSLNPRYYTFIISTAGVKYGIINDGLEFGTSHLHLIENTDERVIIAGEIKIEGRKLIYNFNSGTFSLDQTKKLTWKDNERKYKIICDNVFKMKVSLDDKDLFDTIEYQGDVIKTLFNDTYPDPEEICKICKKSPNDIYTGFPSSDPDVRCTKNSISLIKNKDIVGVYGKLKNNIEIGVTPDTSPFYKKLC